MKISTAHRDRLAASLALGGGRERSAQTGAPQRVLLRPRDRRARSPSSRGLNGTVEARRNLPISAGDELSTDDPGRAEVALADGNVLHVGGGTSVQFVSLYDQQGSDDDVSAIALTEGSVDPLGRRLRRQVRFRASTPTTLTVYAERGLARARQRGSAARARPSSCAPDRSRCARPSGSYTVRAGNYLLVAGRGGARDRARRASRATGSTAGRPTASTSTYESTRSASSQYVGDDYAGDVAVARRQRRLGLQLRPTRATSGGPRRRGLVALLERQLVLHARRPDLVVVRSLGLVSVPLRQLVLRHGLEQLVLVSRLRLLAGLGLLGLTRRSYVGWCPLGWYGCYSPWWNTTTATGSYPRTAAPSRSTDASRRAGWTCAAGTSPAPDGFGTTRGRLDVVPGTRVADRLGNDIAISSRPIVVPARNGVGRARLPARLRSRRCRGRSSATSDRQTQQTARARSSRATASCRAARVDALRDAPSSAERGRLSGPGRLRRRAPRRHGRRRGRNATASTARDPRRGRSAAPAARSSATTDARLRRRGPAGSAGMRLASPERAHDRARDARSPGARGRIARGSLGPAGRRRPRQSPDPTSSDASTREHWRSRANGSVGSVARPRPRAGASPARGSSGRAGDAGRGAGARTTPDVPPARRVIEGSVPGRASTPADGRLRLARPLVGATARSRRSPRRRLRATGSAAPPAPPHRLRPATSCAVGSFRAGAASGSAPPPALVRAAAPRRRRARRAGPRGHRHSALPRFPPLHTAPSGAVFFETIPDSERPARAPDDRRAMSPEDRSSLVANALFVFYCTTVGVYLFLRPGPAATDLPGLLGSGFFRGFVSGLGLVHLARRVRGPSQPDARPRGRRASPRAASEGALRDGSRARSATSGWRASSTGSPGRRSSPCTLRETAGHPDRDLVARAPQTRGNASAHRRPALRAPAVRRRPRGRTPTASTFPPTGLPLPRGPRGTPRGFRVGVSTHSARRGRGRDRRREPTSSSSGRSSTRRPSARYGRAARPGGARGASAARDTHSCEVFAIGGVDESRPRRARAVSRPHQRRRRDPALPGGRRSREASPRGSPRDERSTRRSRRRRPPQSCRRSLFLALVAGAGHRARTGRLHVPIARRAARTTARSRSASPAPSLVTRLVDFAPLRRGLSPAAAGPAPALLRQLVACSSSASCSALLFKVVLSVSLPGSS